ncbi:hypothetical protein WS83_14285 [Burkholderia sp. MSMB2042]|nr:hypothetical protein WS78_04510 [Burkholderia savannae]KVG40480.1 hypothetical protein WS77_18275 [Burkholderia sp. MSMB0265]KVG84640.1 hypothetical protein WS81_05380 [Burkholderia sp. MSMB2040]KVG90208.1 hypothetical protein WS82_18945 [Burkholderia sp. MSMB2041]KVG91213.1 hypothetical protein WS83_14285 [Burkholderia sp. MSMB2042]
MRWRMPRIANANRPRRGRSDLAKRPDADEGRHARNAPLAPTIDESAARDYRGKKKPLRNKGFGVFGGAQDVEYVRRRQVRHWLAADPREGVHL